MLEGRLKKIEKSIEYLIFILIRFFNSLKNEFLLNKKTKTDRKNFEKRENTQYEGDFKYIPYFFKNKKFIFCKNGFKRLKNVN